MKKQLFILFTILFSLSSFFAAPKKTRTIVSTNKSHPGIEFQFFFYEYDDYYVALWAEEKKSDINLFFYSASDYETINTMISDFKSQWDEGARYRMIDSQAWGPGLSEREMLLLKERFFAAMTDFAHFRKNNYLSQDNSDILKYLADLYDYSAESLSDKKEKSLPTIINYYSTDNAVSKIRDINSIFPEFFPPDKTHLELMIYHENTNEFKAAINKWFLPSHPELILHYNEWSSMNLLYESDYQSEGLYKYGNATINHSPDIILLPDFENILCGKEQDILLEDISDIYNQIKNKLEKYPVELISDNNGVYGIPIQNYYGVVFYRRSLAKKYLGTDNPVVVQQYLYDWKTFVKTARLLNKKSNGKCKIISSLDELARPFHIYDKKYWVDKTITSADDEMELYLDVCKTLFDEGLTRNTKLFNKNYDYTFEWTSGLKGTASDENKNPIEVFCCFLSTNGLNTILKKYSPATAGDWAMIEGPSPFYFQSTCIAVTKKGMKTEAAKKFIKAIMTDEEFLKKWAINEGGMITNKNVMNQLKNSYEDPYLANQKPFEILYNLPEKVSIDPQAHLIQRWNLYPFNKKWHDYLYSFLNGTISRNVLFLKFKENEIYSFID